MIGMFAEVNMVVWLFGLTTMGSVVTFISGLIAALAYDKAYKVSVDSSKSAATKTKAETIMDELESEMVRGAVEAFLVNRWLSNVARDWWRAQLIVIEDNHRSKAPQPPQGGGQGAP